MEYLIQHLLINSARRYPDKPAVRFEDASVTYRELDRVTNRLAHMLQAVGVRRGDRVGIYLHKSIASVATIFGILKAGGVYVPLDPNAPAKRLAYITRNCGIKVLLTAAGKLSQVRAFFAEGTPLQTVILTESGEFSEEAWPEGVRRVDWQEVMAQPDEELPPTATIESDLAYILYTSGSTGTPKGVMIAHRTIFTFVNWCRDTFGLTSDDRVTSHAPLHFDLSTFDLFASLQSGATVVIIPERLSVLPVQLADLLQNERITVTYLVPSILAMMVNYGRLDSHDFSALRAVLFAGEVFHTKYLRRLMAAIPRAAYYNLYGPTETNVCTYYRVRPEDVAPERGDQPVPIGQACENIEVFAVTEQGELITEPGREGELWVRGSCVAQGYWGDQEKTAGSFVSNQYQPLFTEFAYRTGDLVTLAPDRKNWCYVGRRDHMIKSRGYRIELGEIEAVLNKHGLVKEAAAVAIPDELLGNRIRAFVVPTDGGGLTTKELEAFCAQQLPKYMIPERIGLCALLPKTSTGKIDRTALRGQAVATARAAV